MIGFVAVNLLDAASEIGAAMGLGEPMSMQSFNFFKNDCMDSKQIY